MQKNSQHCGHQTRFLGSKQTENTCTLRPRLRSNPAGSIQGSPDPLTGLRGPLRSRGRREGKEKRRRNEGKGRVMHYYYFKAYLANSQASIEILSRKRR